MSAAVIPDAGAEDAERAKIEAERAATMAADIEIGERYQAEFDEKLAKVRALAQCETHGELGLPVKEFGEAAERLKNQRQRLLNLPLRWEREDAGLVPQQRAKLRETKPAGRVRWNMVATPLLNAMGVGSEFGPDDPRLLTHDLLIELGIGEDMGPDEQRVEAFKRLCSHVGSYVDSDLMLAAVRGELGQITALLLHGRRLPRISMPADEAGQRLHTRLLAHEWRLSEEQRGWQTVATLDEQALARHFAWRAVLDEEAGDPANNGLHRGQIERELTRVHPEWARAVGLAVPD